MYTVERWQRGHMGALDKYVEENMSRDDAFLRAGELMGSIKAIHSKDGEFKWVEVNNQPGRMFRSKMVDEDGNSTMALYTIMVYKVEGVEEAEEPDNRSALSQAYDEEPTPSHFHG